MNSKYYINNGHVRELLKNGSKPLTNNSILRKLRRYEIENHSYREAIKHACKRHENISWGWDGDCGSENVMDELEDIIGE